MVPGFIHQEYNGEVYKSEDSLRRTHQAFVCIRIQEALGIQFKGLVFSYHLLSAHPPSSFLCVLLIVVSCGLTLRCCHLTSHITLLRHCLTLSLSYTIVLLHRHRLMDNYDNK